MHSEDPKPERRVSCSSCVPTGDLGSALGGLLTKVLKYIPVFTETLRFHGDLQVFLEGLPICICSLAQDLPGWPRLGITSGSHPVRSAMARGQLRP